MSEVDTTGLQSFLRTFVERHDAQCVSVDKAGSSLPTRRARGNLSDARCARAKGSALVRGSAFADALRQYEEGARRARLVTATARYGVAAKGLLGSETADAWLEALLCELNSALCHLRLARLTSAW